VKSLIAFERREFDHVEMTPRAFPLNHVGAAASAV
jgi:hypothetical protein